MIRLEIGCLNRIFEINREQAELAVAYRAASTLQPRHYELNAVLSLLGLLDAIADVT